MVKCKDWTEKWVKRQPVSKDKPWKSFRKLAELLLKAALQVTRMPQSLEANYKEMSGGPRLSHTGPVNGLTNRKTTWKTWKRKKKRTYKMLLIYIVQLLSDHLCLLINRLNPFVLLYIRFLSRAYNSNWNYKSRSVSWLYFQGWNSKNLQVGELHRACILLFYVRCLF